MTDSRPRALIALGSNLASNAGDSSYILAQALVSLCEKDLEICAVSRFFRTPCFPAGAGPDYVNAAVLVSSGQSAGAILAHLHAIEHQFGRERQQRWGMRTLDLDLLALEQTILPDSRTQRHWMDLRLASQQKLTPKQLILPHPRLQDRAFVLVPMADIAADWCHPLLNKTVREMCENLPAEDVAQVQAL